MAKPHHFSVWKPESHGEFLSAESDSCCRIRMESISIFYLRTFTKGNPPSFLLPPSSSRFFLQMALLAHRGERIVRFVLEMVALFQMDERCERFSTYCSLEDCSSPEERFLRMKLILHTPIMSTHPNTQPAPYKTHHMLHNTNDQAYQVISILLFKGSLRVL